MAFLKRLFGLKHQVPTSQNFQVFYSCNGCFEAIQDGDKRYNCVDCTQSYDLCHKCYVSGQAKSHTSKKGPHHTFVKDTQSHTFASTLVHKAKTLEELILNMFKFYGPRPAVGQYDKDGDNYIYLTFSEVFELVRLFASGLNKLLQDGGSGGTQSMVCICSIARLEWYLTDLACLLLSVPTVPIGANSNKEQMRYMLRKAEVSTVVCSASTLKELSRILPECPTVRTVVLMDAACNCTEGLETCDIEVLDSVRLMKFTEVMALGEKHKTNLSKITHNLTDIYTVQFTSGSTGDPKGCVFNRNTWKNRIDKGTILGELHVWLSFHPPSHNLERTSFLVTLLAGGKIGIYRGSMEHLFDDFALVRPTYVSSTPRLWTMLYNQYLQELHEAYTLYQSERSAATPVNEDNSATGSVTLPQDAMKHFDIEKVPHELKSRVMLRFKSKLGGRERRITTGGAPTGKLVKKFIIECFDGMVSEGYGSTEVGGIAHDGMVVTRSDVKLIDAPEMGYFTTDKPPRGEICVKTSAMIDGYFKSPDITAEKFVDGYFLTGDIGVADGDCKLKVIDRKKNIFKLSQGEFVSPERLEALYVGASCFINQMYVYGNSLQANVVAVVVPEREEILKLGRVLGEDAKVVSDLCQLQAVKKALVEELQRIGSENSLPGWEIPVDIILDSDPFTVENGLLTSTQKKSRPKLEQKYKLLLEEVYEKLNNSSSHKRPLEIVVFEWLKSQLHDSAVTSDTSEKDAQGLIDQDMIEKSFGQMGGDSLAAMHLSSLLREHLSLDLPVDVVLKTPLVNILDASSEKGPHTMATVSYDWVQEASLDALELDACQECPLSQVTEVASSVLLTGCTGFLGRFILWELLQDSHIEKIFCLAQNKTEVSAKNRIMKILSQLQLEFGCDAVNGVEKLVIMAGDLSKPGLGLNEEDYTTLCEEVDTIIHNGAIVNSVLPYSALKNCNVESTKTLISIAVASKPKFFHYVSTIGVFSRWRGLRAGNVDESVKPSAEGLDYLSGYSQSKWVAESLVLAAIAEGKIMGNISRPGLIGPHTETGHVNAQDWVYWIVRGLIKMGMVPTGEGCEGKKIYWVPVDQVAKTILLVSCDHKGWVNQKKENIFHLVNSSTPITFTALTDALMLVHSEMKTTSYRQFRVELKKLCKVSDDQVLGSLDLLLPMEGGWPNATAYYSESHKVAKFGEAGIHLGQLHDRYVQKYILNCS